MGTLRFQVERAASFLTKQIGRYWGESFPFYYLAEYPKSGGTWLANMLADYLDIPFPRKTRLPIGFSCILHNHWTYDPKLRRVVTLYRDGRDVMNSLFYDRIRVGQHSDEAGSYKVREIYRKVLGRNASADDIVELLPRFLEYEFSNPGRGVHATWADFVSGWHDKPHVISVSYEELLQDTYEAMSRVLQEITDQEIDRWRLETAIEKYSFERVTGRRRGTSNIATHARKAIIGDWKNSFSREAAEVFNHYAGKTLVELGYEEDEQWIDRTEFVATRT